MIIKEYRVVMPVSVEEYQVAQLYMVAKLSTQQTGAVSSPSVFFFWVPLILLQAAEKE
jgi:hypothetical protein